MEIFVKIVGFTAAAINVTLVSAILYYLKKLHKKHDELLKSANEMAEELDRCNEKI